MRIYRECAYRLWGFCHTLRHDGIDYGEYIEQLIYLFFLKMADERSVAVPPACDWETLRAKSGTDLTDHWSDVLRVTASRGVLRLAGRGKKIQRLIARVFK